VTLPTPSRSRWQPLRGGLMNLYYFEDLRLHYEDGRLLLRGNNGTGKSRILALQLPFLLDGEIASSRVEPDGDPSKRIEWHLLMDRYPDRVGYTWLEFGRVGDDGMAHFTTIGCGLKAVQGKGAPTRWYFVTKQRIDADLQLANKSKVPIGRQALLDAIGERGRLFDKSSEYRVAVDRALFELGEQRYGALLDLLIQLRRPQLSRKLDEKLLSDALSRALPPLSERTIADVAEAFRSLEQDRSALEQDRSALDSTERFHEIYCRYVQMATRRRAEGVRQSHSEYEQAQRRLRDAEVEAARATTELERLTLALQECERERIQVDAALHELAGDPAHRDAKRIEEAKDQARRAQDEAARAEEQALRASERLDRERLAVQRAADRLAAGRTKLVDARTHTDALAARVGLGQLLTDLDERRVSERVEARGRHTHHLELLARERDAKRSKSERAKLQVDDARSESERAIVRRDEKRTKRDQSHERLSADLTAWLDDLEVLEISAIDGLFEALVDWSEQGEGEGPIATAVANAHAIAVAYISAQMTKIEVESKVLGDQLRELETERRELTSGTHRRPRAPAWRDDEARATRDGAPLWALCDFIDEIEPDQRVAYEAALEASGILDAWVTPEGHVLAADDVFLCSGEPLTRSLARVLVPAIDKSSPHAGRVDEATVASILASIGSEPVEGRAWVAADGRFALGPTIGHARKEAAEHIGHGAREQARRRQLERIEVEIARVSACLEQYRRELSTCEERRQRADRERDTSPKGTSLRDTVRELADADREVSDRERALLAAVERHELVATEVRDADEKLVADAEQFGLSEWLDALPELKDLLRQLENALEKVWDEKRRVDTLDDEYSERLEAAQDAVDTLQSETERVEEANTHRHQTAARHQVLLDTVGAKVEELQRKLTELRQRGRDVDGDAKRLRSQKSKADQDVGAAGSSVADRTSYLAEREQRRAEAIGHLQALARTRIWVALGEAWDDRDVSTDWSPTAAIDVARELDKQLRAVAIDDATWDRVTSTLQRGVQDLTNALSAHGFTPSTMQAAEVLVVTIMYQARSLGPSELMQTLIEEIQSRERILDEREREILENHLIVEVAHHLHDKIRGGERLITEMNREIESRPLSTGMRFRFKWAPRSDPAEISEIRKRLLAAHGVWSPEDRKAIGSFLHRRIQEERTRSETGTWADHLNKALDYRDWHEFQIERLQNEQWRRLNRKTYGTGSGGEKAIALTLPQLAAAAAHYRSASDHAPRLILMDEAFVGVDSDMRAKCMGLLAAFDLDFVMTSEREWGCYDTLPALAIYQLVTRPGVDAVHETRWVWNGRDLLRETGGP
jgi:uncharacterized protein (TIGR02680 family)